MEFIKCDRCGMTVDKARMMTVGAVGDGDPYQAELDSGLRILLPDKQKPETINERPLRTISRKDLCVDCVNVLALFNECEPKTPVDEEIAKLRDEKIRLVRFLASISGQARAAKSTIDDSVKKKKPVALRVDGCLNDIICKAEEGLLLGGWNEGEPEGWKSDANDRMADANNMAGMPELNKELGIDEKREIKDFACLDCGWTFRGSYVAPEKPYCGKCGSINMTIGKIQENES